MTAPGLDLTGRVAVVTGASRGIGRAVALALADAGADVAVAARSAADLDDTAAAVRKAGRRALAVRTDVARAADVEALMSRTVDEFGRLDVLVNNSGIGEPHRALDTTEEVWDRHLDVNAKGTFLCCQAAARHMLAQGSGKIINVTSIFALKGVPNYAAYSASKAAIVGLTRALAVEWAGDGLQVNAVAPGYLATDINAEARADPDRLANLVRSVPARRIAEPDEIGPLIVYLASSASDYMTGAILTFDGGWHAR
ncbi:MAG: glucose 1-dehydrogenase [Actinomycetota bacterium]|jgi:NAD(P)-dependent dehydrogenase (short-subunit alcohol dehydrogenase family)